MFVCVQVEILLFDPVLKFSSRFIASLPLFFSVRISVCVLLSLFYTQIALAHSLLRWLFILWHFNVIFVWPFILRLHWCVVYMQYIELVSEQQTMPLTHNFRSPNHRVYRVWECVNCKNYRYWKAQIVFSPHSIVVWFVLCVWACVSVCFFFTSFHFILFYFIFMRCWIDVRVLRGRREEEEGSHNHALWLHVKVLIKKRTVANRTACLKE